MNIPDQKVMWDAKHGAGQHAAFRDEPAAFAVEIESSFPREARVLDLGCGVGRDAQFFAQKGHSVLATDFSTYVIEEDKELIKLPKLEFKVADMTKPINSTDNNFDVVYSHLSLHYYDDATTKSIFKEVARVLKPGGILAFVCKSPKDPDNADGIEVSPGLFVSKSGHARHFFTVDYSRQLLAADFDVKSVKETQETYIGKTSHFVQCIATKKL